MADIVIPAVTVREPAKDTDGLELNLRQHRDNDGVLQRTIICTYNHPKRQATAVWTSEKNDAALPIDAELNAAIDALLRALVETDACKAEMGFIAKPAKIVKPPLEEPKP